MMGTDKPSYKDFRRHPEAFEILEVVLDELIGDNFLDNPFLSNC